MAWSCPWRPLVDAANTGRSVFYQLMTGAEIMGLSARSQGRIRGDDVGVGHMTQETQAGRAPLGLIVETFTWITRPAPHTQPRPWLGRPFAACDVAAGQFRDLVSRRVTRD